jgi:hypothetical protein
MNKIIIHEPFIIVHAEKTRLSALIERPNNAPFELFYEVDNEYAGYLCDERVDAFLIGILEFITAKLRTSKIIRKLYYRFNIDVLRYGEIVRKWWIKL